MDKKTFRSFAKLVGNAEDLLPIANEYDEDKPDNWDELSEEEQKKWEEEHMVKAQAQAKPEPKTELKPSPAPQIPEGIMQLNVLVEELGGIEAFKNLLLSAATITANALSQEEKEHAELVKTIVANAADQLTPDDLADVPVATLRKMAAVTSSPIGVDYSLFGAVNVNAKGEDMAIMPNIFDPETWKK
jgi:hypothetical protein